MIVTGQNCTSCWSCWKLPLGFIYFLSGIVIWPTKGNSILTMFFISKFNYLNISFSLLPNYS